MTTSTAAPPAPAKQQGGKHQRSIKNYLLDSRFQLKYSSYLVAVALVVSSVLGVFLYRSSGEVVAQSQRVAAESRKVSEVVRMNIRDDPMYKDNPELAAAFNQESGAAEKKIDEQQKSLIAKQQTMLQALVGGLLVMCFLIGLVGIFITHKIAGPIYKMKMLMRQVGDGKLNFHGRLRKGDELEDFFVTFQEMVEKLKARQAKEVATLEAAMEEAKTSGLGATSLSKIAAVRDEMKRALDV